MLNDQGYGSHAYMSSLLPLNYSRLESARSESTFFGDVTAVNNNTDNAKPVGKPGQALGDSGFLALKSW